MNAFAPFAGWNAFKRGAFGEAGAAPWVDPLAAYTFALRLQTHRGDGVPVGLFQDAAGTVPATADGDPVGCWKDVLGAGLLSATQSVSTQRPTLRFRSGIPTLAFDGVDDFLQTTVTSNTLRTMFSAQKSTDITAFRTIVDDGNVQCFMGQNNAGKGVIIDSIGSIREGSGLTTNKEVWTGYYFTGSPGEMRLRQAGVDNLLVLSGTFGSASAMRIGRAGNNSAAWQGDITSILLATTSFAVPDIEAVEIYLDTL